MQDRLRRLVNLNNVHVAFMKRAKEEEEGLATEKAKYLAALQQLDDKHRACLQKQRAHDAFVAQHQIKQANLMQDTREGADKVLQIQTRMENYLRDVSMADMARKAELSSLQTLQRDMDAQILDIQEDKRRISEAALVWERANRVTIQECDAARKWAFDAFVRWVRYYPLLHMHVITEDSLLLGYEKLASCQGMVGEWSLLRSLLESFQQICDDYTPVPEDCSNLPQAQQEKLRHFSRFVQSLQERTEESQRNADRLSESIRSLEALRLSLRGLSTDLGAALERDLQSAQADAQEDAVRPLSSLSCMSESASPRERHVEELGTWQWCRDTDILYSPELESIQAALNAADTDCLFYDMDSPESGQDEEQRCSARARAVLLGLETRRISRDVQWASTMTAHEAIRKITQAISYKEQPLLLSGSMLGGGAAAGEAPSEEALRRYFGWCEYIPLATHLALALDGHSFPCAPELLAHSTSKVLDTLGEAERAEQKRS